MPKSNKMLRKLEGLKYATSLYLNMGYHLITLIEKKVAYVWLIYHVENTVTRFYQWELATPQKIFNWIWMDFSKCLNLYVNIYMTFWCWNVYCKDQGQKVELALNKKKEIG